MNDAPIQIRNPEVVRAIRMLAEQSGLPITKVVSQAVGEALMRHDVERRQRYEERLKAIRDISRRFTALPSVGPTLTDDDLYDEDGLAR